MVDAAPPEFAAAALERLLESGAIDDPPTRRELIEHAFQLAGMAHDRWRVHALPGAGANATMRARASDLQLDQISLQTHAVRLMLAVDKDRARAIFLGLESPGPRQILTPAMTGRPPIWEISTALSLGDERYSDAARRARYGRTPGKRLPGCDHIPVSVSARFTHGAGAEGKGRAEAHTAGATRVRDGRGARRRSIVFGNIDGHGIRPSGRAPAVLSALCGQSCHGDTMQVDSGS